MFNRSRRRLASLFSLSMGSILILFAFSVYYREVQDLLEEFDRSLYEQSQKIATQTVDRLQGKDWRLDLENISQQENMGMSQQSQISYVRWYSSQKKLVEFSDRHAPRYLDAKIGFQTIKNLKLQPGKHKKWLRQLTLPVKQNDSTIAYIQVAQSLQPIQKQLAQTRLFLSLGVPITLGLTGLVGWFLAGVAMQPIRRSYDRLQRFTADASHELRAPIAAILSNAQVSLLAPVEDSSEQRKRTEKIVTITKSMSSLVSNLLFLARHEGRLNPKDLNTIDILNLLESLAEEYKTLAWEKELNFVSKLPSVAINIRGDRELLRQAITNLLNNSLKYTPAGGNVELRLFTQLRRVVIEVEDTGIGIPAKDLPHIFERFYRVDKARSRRDPLRGAKQTGGFGLGLAIVEQIIQAHCGQITANSTEGVGTTFQICLPLY